MRWFLVLFLFFQFAFPSFFAESMPQPFDPTKTESVPGVQICLIDQTGKLSSWQFGMRDLANQLPMENHTTQLIYSMTKAVTAVAILQLVQSGKLSLNQTLQSILPEIPYAEPITIGQVLSQSSGIPNPIPLRWVHLPNEEFAFSERQAWLKRLEENPRLDFIPGKKNSYSNLSYWSLGFVVEKLSGLSYQEYIKANILNPLRIPERELGFTFSEIHSKGYLKRYSFLNLFKSFLVDQKFIGEASGSYVEILPHHVDGKATGGLIGSACGFAKVFSDLIKPNPVLLSSKYRDILFTTAKDNSGEDLPMTFGFHSKTKENRRIFFKEGGGAGFHGEIQIPESKEYVIVVIGNDTSFRAGSLADDWVK